MVTTVYGQQQIGLTNESFVPLTTVGEKLLILMSFIHILATSFVEASFFTAPLLRSAAKEKLWFTEFTPNINSD